MKHHSLLIFLVFSILSLPTAQYAQAFIFTNNVEKAREFVQANMVDKAIGLLQAEIEKKPTNAEAHYELGSIYLQQGNFGQAEQRFKGAASFDVGLKARIVERYTDADMAMMNRGNEQDATRCFDATIAYQPSLRFMKFGIPMLNIKTPGKAFKRFEIAAAYQPSLKSKIA